MPCETFPIPIKANIDNPAIWLFGNRLFNEQSPIEFLVELLLVVASSKRLGERGAVFGDALPPFDVIDGWELPPPQELQYAPKARLNLKLFAFMGASRLDSRHETHRTHYRELLKKLELNRLAAATLCINRSTFRVASSRSVQWAAICPSSASE